jgi:hypothetical protein
MKYTINKALLVLVVIFSILSFKSIVIHSNSDSFGVYRTIELGFYNSKSTFSFNDDGLLEFEIAGTDLYLCDQTQTKCVRFSSPTSPLKGSIEVSSLFVEGSQQMIAYFGGFNAFDIFVENGVGYYLPNENAKQSRDLFIDLYDRDEQYYLGLTEFTSKMTVDQYKQIKAVVDELVVDKATDYEKLIEIHKWVVTNIHYDYDCYERGICLADGAYTTFSMRRGVCHDYSVLINMMLRIAGIPTVYLSGVAVYKDEGHAWNATFVNGKWLVFDSTWGSYSVYRDGVYNTSSTYRMWWFDVGLDEFSKSHLLVNLPYYPISYEKRPVGLEIVKLPTKINYIIGESLSLAGAEIYMLLRDGSKAVVNNDHVSISGFEPYIEQFGPQTVTVTYQGLTTTFEVYLNRFTDVPYGHRNYTHINALVGLGIINGYSDNTFRPSNTLTRAQAAIMIVRAIGLSTEGVSSSFTDVPPTHAAYKFISAAYQAGIINGYSDGTFRPNANVTRAQIAIMVQRAFNVQASETVISFTDVPEGYAPKKFIETLASQKIVNGYSDGTFKPLNNVTRAQFSTMIYNAIQYAHKTE